MSLSSGTRFGTYELRSLVGQGGMGEVYRARDTQHQRRRRRHRTDLDGSQLECGDERRPSTIAAGVSRGG